LFSFITLKKMFFQSIFLMKITRYNTRTLSGNIWWEGSHLETLFAPKCDPKTHFRVFSLASKIIIWIYCSRSKEKIPGLYFEILVERGSHLDTLHAPYCDQTAIIVLFLCFLSTLNWSYKRYFMSISSWKKVNKGQLRSIKINYVQWELIKVCPSFHASDHPSIGW